MSWSCCWAEHEKKGEQSFINKLTAVTQHYIKQFDHLDNQAAEDSRLQKMRISILYQRVPHAIISLHWEHNIRVFKGAQDPWVCQWR